MEDLESLNEVWSLQNHDRGHENLEFSCMEVVHTKLNPDWHFGIWKDLLIAAKSGDLKAVEKSLENGANVNCTDEDRFTPLHYASDGGFVDVASLLISKGADINSQDAGRNTPLHRASERGFVDVASQLISKGADIHSRGEWKYTPLHWAAQGGFVDVAELLISKGADIQSQDVNKYTPLHWAAQGGFVDVAELLISKGADIQSQDVNGETPLHYASEGGFVDVASLLISKGADINSQDAGKYTPLHWAARRGFVDVAELLISKGADIHSRDYYKYTPLHWAAQGGFVDVAELLISKGADIQSQDVNKNTPLHRASERGFVDVASLLISKGADIHSQGKWRFTPLHEAARGGFVDVAELLISKGADIHSRGEWRFTPLHEAARGGFVDVAELLISKGADIHSRGEWGQTALDVAEGKAEILLQLVESGVNVSHALEAAKHCDSLTEAQEFIQSPPLAADTVPINMPPDVGVQPSDDQGMLHPGEITVDEVQQPDQVNALSRINDATTFKTLLADGTYESFGNRIYLAGACKVGKSTLASLLIGDKIPLKWKSTDGLRIFFGRNGIDVKNKTMVPLKRGKGDRDVLSKVLRGRPDIKRYQSNQDVTLIYSRCSGGTEQQAVSGISVSRSSTFKQTSPENVPSYTTSVENVHTIKGTTTTFVKPKQIKKLSEVKFISIHKDIKKKLRKGKYRVHIAPSDLVDFGGQKSYDMTHQLFIQGKGTFTLIFDGRKQLQDPLQEYQQRDITTESILKHWVDSILTYCGEDDDDIIPVILFVATHRDKINKDQQLKKIQEFNDGLTKMFQNHERQQRIDYNDIFFINATDANDQEVIRLKEKYVDIAFKQKSWGKRMPMAWVPLDLQMNAMKENNISLISKKELEELNTANDDLALTKEQLEHFLLEQHSSGKILYFEGHGLGKYIIVQPTALVDILRSFITDEMFWPKDSKLTRILKEMTKSGKIKKRDLFKLWSQKEFHQHMPSDDFKEFIAHVLVHLDLLVEPNTRENICDYYLVPCAVKDTPPKTAFGDQMVGDTKTICLSYKLLKSSIPSALSFKLIGAAMNIWPLKETENGICLYHKAAIFCIDKSNTLHILVQNNQVMVCLKNETSNNFISPDIASCVQDCLTLTLRTALEFYHTSFGNVVSKLTIADLFKIEAMHKCESEICYVSLTETKINPRWKCSLGKEHRTKFPLYWTYKGQQNCHKDCEGLHEQCLNLCPEDKHLARFARCLEIQELYDIVILLGLSRKDWNDFEYKHRGQGVEPLMMEIDILCHWKRKIAAKPSFKDLFEALKGIRPKHILCQILREDRTVLDVKGEILQGPPDNDTLLDLSRQIGNCAIHLGVELGIDFCEIQETMYDYKKMSQQNYDILKKWKEAPHGHNKTIRYLMHVLRIVNPVGFKFLQEKYNIV